MRHYCAVRITLGSILGVAAALALSAGVQAQRVRIELTSLTTVLVQHETKPKGRPHKGDWIEFKDLLLNRAAQFGKAKGRPVAWDEGEVLYTSATNRSIRVLAIFPGIGSITYTGDFPSPRSVSAVARITGGTGGFRGASGTVTIGPGAASAPNIFLVTVPHPFDIHAAGGVA
jgi:hypothetical protein